MEEKRKFVEIIIKDCEKMANLAYDLEGCDGCVGCESFNNCFMGIRNSIGDIAKTLKFIFENLKSLDETVADLSNVLREHDILPEKKDEEGAEIYS